LSKRLHNFEKPTASEVRDVQTYIRGNIPVARKEMEYIQHVDDLVTLRSRQLRSDFLVDMSSKTLVWLWDRFVFSRVGAPNTKWRSSNADFTLGCV
jgi:hypothetical protein